MDEPHSFLSPLHGDAAASALARGSYACARVPEDLVVVEGPDATDLLHRISASTVLGLAEDAARTLLFTDDKGRLIAAPLAWRQGEAWILAAGHGRGSVLEEWIDRWIITEDVRTRRGLAPAVLAILLAEEDEGRVLGALGFDSADPGRKLRSGSGATLIRPETAVRGPSLFVPDAVEHMLEVLERLPLIDAQTAREAAVRAGRVECGPALDQGPNPLEIGWKDLVDFGKGCYIGQEVIARLDTYDKVQRGLAHVKLVARVAPGSELRKNGRQAGRILDVAYEHERTLAIALVHKSLPDGATVYGPGETAGTLHWIPAAS